MKCITPVFCALAARLRGSFRARVLAAGVTLVLATGALTSAILILSVRSVFVDEIEGRAASLAQSSAARAQFPLLVGDEKELQQLGQEALANEDVMFVEISGKSGSGVRVARPGLAMNPQTSGTASGARSLRLWNGSYNYFEVQWPVEAPTSGDLLGVETRPGSGREAIGAVRVGVSLERARATVLSAVLRAIGGVLLAMALLLWLEWRRLRRLLAPLQRLADFTFRVGRGNLQERAAVEGLDEISSLARAFNRMLDRLAATLVSKDLAEQANLAKSRFLATTGHELRTPLNAIIGYSEMLEEECEDRGLDDLLPDLNRIRNSGKMLLELMNDLLDYSKAEAGKMHMAIEEVAVGPVLEEVAGTVEPMARKNGNRVVVETSPEDLWVRADRGRFRQSLLNLASNACKFTENGVVTLSAALSPRGSEECDIHVRDTGIGIAESEIAKLFEAFVQVDSSHTRRHGGTGLGLAISRKFCRLMSGDIRVQSAPGQGSVFTISLPAAQNPGLEIAGGSEEKDVAVTQKSAPEEPAGRNRR